MFDTDKKLDFDTAMRLAREDPQAFEAYRREAIDAFIGQAPARNRERLRRLQWRIDQERRRSGNPLSACVRLYDMMWDSFAGEQGLVSHLQHADRLVQGEPLQPLPSGQVLAFSRV